MKFLDALSLYLDNDYHLTKCLNVHSYKANQIYLPKYYLYADIIRKFPGDILCNKNPQGVFLSAYKNHFFRYEFSEKWYNRSPFHPLIKDYFSEAWKIVELPYTFDELENHETPY